VTADQNIRPASWRDKAIRCEQCGSRKWVVIESCTVCARCGAVWPVQGLPDHAVPERHLSQTGTPLTLVEHWAGSSAGTPEPLPPTVLHPAVISTIETRDVRADAIRRSGPAQKNIDA
jgi:hypothetical protein